jgi:hypothetical protein
MLELDTTLYPGNWADYVANEWPTFTANTNIDRNILIEDYTGHKCIFCPAAADLAHQLEVTHEEPILKTKEVAKEENGWKSVFNSIKKSLG